MLLSLILKILSEICGGEDVHETCTGLGLAEVYCIILCYSTVEHQSQSFDVK